MTMSKRQSKLSNRRRTAVVTRKAELAQLKEVHFAELAQAISGLLEPHLAKLVEAEVNKAMYNFAARQLDASKPAVPTEGNGYTAPANT